MGQKTVANDLDNARVWFDQVRVLLHSKQETGNQTMCIRWDIHSLHLSTDTHDERPALDEWYARCASPRTPS